MSDTLTQTEEEQLLELVVRSQLEIARLEEVVKNAKSFFKQEALYPAGTNKEVGKFYIKVGESKRVDDKLARTVLGEDYKVFTKETIDGIKAKRELAPDVYAKIQKTYENRIEIGLN